MNPWRHIAHLNRDEIRRLQNNRLQAFISRYVYPFSPHYRKLFQKHGIRPEHIRRMEDLKHLPFTSKVDFMNGSEGDSKFKDFILQPSEELVRKNWPWTKLAALAFQNIVRGKAYTTFQLKNEFKPVFMTYTTGTTSKPTPFLYSNYDMENLRLAGARLVNLFEIEEDEKIANIFPYAPHLAFWQVVSAGFAACAFILSTGGGKTLGTEGNIKALTKLQPSVVLGVPSFIYHVLRTAHDEGDEAG